MATRPQSMILIPSVVVSEVPMAIMRAGSRLLLWSASLMALHMLPAAAQGHRNKGLAAEPTILYGRVTLQDQRDILSPAAFFTIVTSLGDGRAVSKGFHDGVYCVHLK